MNKPSFRIASTAAVCAAAITFTATSARAGLLYEPSSYASQDNIVVNDGGICEPEPGNYKVDGTWTFTATTALDEHGVETRVRGYTVETWNDSEWVRSGSGTGDTYDYSDSTGKIRLTWNATQPAFFFSIH